MTRYEILEAPSVLGLFPKGVEGLSGSCSMPDLLSGWRPLAVRSSRRLPYAGGIDAGKRRAECGGARRLRSCAGR